ncbi:conserved protein of unknown function [Nitrospira japonica]|uniref:Uncharacterized protein n=1 Tax=Nitrospira japonica TaxID=1325564 RepID=A0A1W1I6G8_9BACT|nr:conserved protein of unknown function [Nitrospira japonica]
MTPRRGETVNRSQLQWRLAVSSLLCAVTLLDPDLSLAARDLVAPKEQSDTEIDPTLLPSFDDQKKGIPQAIFVWIKMAKGYDVEWDSFGRKGWYTQDPRLKPIDPGTVFTPDTPAIYIVFEVAPLEDPAQFSAQWFLEGPDRTISASPIGKDTLEVPGHERYGFLELKRPGDKWATGTYLAKLFITPLGQQPFHAVNQVGTMRFTVAEASSSGQTGSTK